MLPFLIVLLLATALKADDYVRIYRKGESKPLVFNLLELDSIRFSTNDSTMLCGIVFAMKVDSFSQIFFAPNYEFSKIQQLTHGARNSGFPRICTDGSKILFDRDRPPDWVHECWLMNRNGTQQVQITDHPAGWIGCSMASWSDNSERLFYSRIGGGNKDDQIRSVNIDGTDDSLFFAAMGVKCNWPAPNPIEQNLLAFTYLLASDNNCLHKHIRLRTIETGVEQIISETMNNVLDESDLQWDPIGKHLLWTATEVNGNRSLKIYSLETGAVSTITNEFNGGYATFTSNGKQIIYPINYQGRGRIYRIDLDGRNKSLLYEGSGEIGSLDAK